MAVQGNLAKVSADFVSPDGTKTMWFECDAEYADQISAETSDSFFLIALLIAMQRGFDLRIEGPLSSRLYHNAKTQYMEVLHVLIPSLRKIRIEASKLIRQNWGGTGVMTGFSGGIDSFCTIIDHSEGRVPPEFQVSHLLFNNVGSHGQTEKDEAVFRERYARLVPHAQTLGLPFIAVNSNLDDVLDTNYQLTHTLRNVAVALLFQKGCARYLYSSTVHYGEARVEPTYDMGFADTIGLSLLSTETMTCQSSGSQRQRFEKTAIVASYPPTYAALDVCVAPVIAEKTNCSKCWKCMRTELTLEVLGMLDRYEGVFNLNRYRQFRWLFLARILAGTRPLAREIQAEIKRFRFKVPVSAQITAMLLPYVVLDKAFEIVTDPARVRRKLAKISAWLAGRSAPVAETAGWSRWPALMVVAACTYFLLPKL